ncbi:hypothetical protein D3C76_1326340 [compost metagenome]
MDGVALAAPHRIPEVADKLHEVEQLLRIRLLVDPVQERYLHPIEMLRHGFVGSKHKFLNNLFRNGTLPLDNRGGFALFVHQNLRFLEVKVDGSPAHAFVPQLQSQLLHQQEVVHQSGIPLHQLAPFLHQCGFIRGLSFWSFTGGLSLNISTGFHFHTAQESICRIALQNA